ncbi:MAG TPA: alkaline phosphatase family protein [Acidimicrobiales bacterium]|nr:alkaline phosphatase family protein [Acidimicrobiales bacterium]
MTAALVSPVGPGAGARPAFAAGAAPHVMVIVEENREFGDVIGDPSAPYVNSLASHYLLATQSYATTHPSLPNYLELIGGSTFGISSDCTSCTVDGTTLVDQLAGAGYSWRAYMEDSPSPCYQGDSAGDYAKKHDPFVYFSHLTANPSLCDNVVPFSQMAGDLSSASPPDFAWVTPNLCDDGHDCPNATMDGWLSSNLPGVLASPWYRDGGTVIITWDEGSSSAGCCGGAAGGQVATMVVSAATAGAGAYGGAVDHAGVLRSIEDLYGVGHLGDAASAASGELPLRPASSTTVAMAATSDGGGYWTTTASGATHPFGDAGSLGSPGALAAPVVGMAATPDGGGYWLVASDGGIFTYGDARFFGSAGAMHLAAPVVGMAATPDGGGYWLVGSDGGVFTYGDAGFFGSGG